LDLAIAQSKVWFQLNAQRIAESKRKQEAQLSQRDHATLCVIERFGKSLKISEGHSKLGCCVGHVSVR